VITPVSQSQAGASCPLKGIDQGTCLFDMEPSGRLSGSPAVPREAKELPAADRQWVMRPDPAIEFWYGETKKIGHGLTLIRCGGHFEGGTVLHWPDGAGGNGVILSGDILQVVQDRRWVSFMYSYPNLIPLPASTVQRIVAAVEAFEFDRIYGAWWGKIVATDAKAAVKRSAERYVQALEDRHD